MQSKPYIHVEDVISAMFIALKNQKKIYDVYNVAPKDPATVNQIADIVLEELGIDKLVCKYKYTGGNRGWKGDVPIVRLDTKKISDLGWESSMNSVGAVKKSVKEMLKNIVNITKDD